MNERIATESALGTQLQLLIQLVPNTFQRHLLPFAKLFTFTKFRLVHHVAFVIFNLFCLGLPVDHGLAEIAAEFLIDSWLVIAFLLFPRAM